MKEGRVHSSMKTDCSALFLYLWWMKACNTLEKSV